MTDKKTGKEKEEQDRATRLQQKMESGEGINETGRTAREEESRQSDFLIEKFKERPVNKRKLMKRTLITAALAVIFGLIACVTFLLLEPVLNNWLYPEEEPEVVLFPEDPEEMSPEEMLSDTMQQQKQKQQQEQEQQAKEEEEKHVQEEAQIEQQIQAYVDSYVHDKEDYKEIYTSLSSFVSECNKSMVTITGVNSDIDWFNNVTESSNQAFGVVVANNGRELLILAGYSTVKSAEKLTVTFYNNVQATAQIKQADEGTDLAILSVARTDVPRDALEQIQIAVLGSSNSRNLVGTPVIALGSPMGVSGSVGYGMITAAGKKVIQSDINYKLLYTDIYGSQNARGVIFNLKGELIGVITRQSPSDIKNLVSAYGISELKPIIEKMSNGQAVAYLGIHGMDVTKEAHEELNVPYGAYVKEVEMDSPAMLAGIQTGDVIVSVGGVDITKYMEYTAQMMSYSAGRTIDVVIMRQSQEEYKEMNFTITLSGR